MTAFAQRPARSPRNMPAATSIRSWHSMLHANNIVFNSGLKMSGTGTVPAITVSGTQKRLLDLRVEVNDVSGGTSRGQAKFRWFEDGGTTPAQSAQTTAATFNLVHPTFGDTGLQLQFPAGTYAADHVGIGKVVQWNDRSLRGNHYENLLAGDGTALPKLFRNATTGRWALRFIKASGTFLRIASSAYCTELVGGNDTPITTFTVFGVYGTIGVEHFIESITNTTVGTSAIGSFAYTDSKWGVSKRGETGAELFTTGGTADNGIHLAEDVSFGTTRALWIDGAQVIGTGGAGVAQDVPSLTVTEAYIGGIRSGANIYGDVDIYAQARYVGALSADERGFLRQMFKQRYGTP